MPTLKWIFCFVLAVAPCIAGVAKPAAEDPTVADAVRMIQTEAAGHRLIMLGEKHGTREIPVLVAELVSAYSEHGPVLLGLEVHRGEHAALRRYLASDGSRAARTALASTPFWTIEGVQHDGRRSQDMLDLVEHLRQLRGQGRDVAILPFDVTPEQSRTGDSETRDRLMARRVRAAFELLPRGRLVALAGNVHAMRHKPPYAPPDMQRPMTSWLTDLEPFSVDIVARSGDFWACTDSCGPLAGFPGVGESHRTQGPFDLRIVLPAFHVARLLGAD